ncbi:hypothetical protein EniLVp02_0080 [Vibrio phage EniLVp02]
MVTVQVKSQLIIECWNIGKALPVDDPLRSQAMMALARYHLSKIEEIGVENVPTVSICASQLPLLAKLLNPDYKKE